MQRSHHTDVYPLLGPVGAAVTSAAFLNLEIWNTVLFLNFCGSQILTCSELRHKSLHAGRHRALHVKWSATQSLLGFQNSREALRCLDPHPVPTLPDNEAHSSFLLGLRSFNGGRMEIAGFCLSLLFDLIWKDAFRGGGIICGCHGNNLRGRGGACLEVHS